MQKVWKLNKYDENKIKELMKQYNISEMLAKLILSRDIENVDIRPQTVKRLIQQENYNGITHNINYDWAECNEDIKGMKK